MDERYSKLATPPVSALKVIQVGRNKGKSDINPQWKYEAMTEVYGLCGLGWEFAIDETNIIDLPNGEKMIFMKVALHIKDGDNWSEPIYGYGGDFIVKKETAGLHADDEAYKKCLTDALGNALKNIGVAADVYRGMFDTKYGKPVRTEPKDETPQASNKKGAVSEIKTYVSLLKGKGIDPNQFTDVLFNRPVNELTKDQITATINNTNRAIAKYHQILESRKEEIPT